MVEGYYIEITSDRDVKVNKNGQLTGILEQILEMANIQGEYTLEDLANNKEGILTNVLENKNAVQEIVKNSNTFLEVLTNSEVALIEIAKSSNMKDEITDNNEWLNKVIEKGKDISGFNEQMQTIPQMTGNTEPGGECITNSVFSEYYAWKAFDRNKETFWYANPIANKPTEMYYVMYKYNKNHNIYKIDVNSVNPTSNIINDVPLEIYISAEEEGENSWEKVYEEKYSLSGVYAPHDVSCSLEDIASVRRIKLCSMFYNPPHRIVVFYDDWRN